MNAVLFMRMTIRDCYSGGFKPARNLAWRNIFLLALCAGIAGCASVPDVNGTVDQSFSAKSRPQIMGAHGPLTARQSKVLFARMGADIQNADQLQRHLLIEQAVAESPLVSGNSTRVLHDGTETFRSMFAAIRSAKDHINLEYFIFEDVESDGKKLSDLLVEKRTEGVTVNVIYDSFGSSGTAAPFLDQLKQAGVTLVQFNPLDPFTGRKSWSPNNRDHRKILIVDGTVAIVGGINLSTTYQRYSFGKSGAPEGASRQHWRDTDLEITGPAVAQLQLLFLDHWKEQKGPTLDEAKFFPVITAKGGEVVRIIGSAPADKILRYYITLLSAVRNAEKSVWLDAAYFVPTGQEKRDLIDAARRGVDVRIMLPDKSDSDRSLAVQHSHYADLMEAGVKIYEIHDEVLHSKTVVIDGVWSVIGSSNFDHRSAIYNDEVDAVVLGRDTGHALEGMFEADMQKARQIDPAVWKKRPFIKKVNEKLSLVLQNLL
jgi:cardiolipin synthase